MPVPSAPFPVAVFSDFDGTITLNETLAKTFLHFVPDLAPEILRGVSHRRVTLRQALQRLVSAIPSRVAPEILALTGDEPLRPGFGELLEFLAACGTPFVVVSSGLRFYIEAKLAPWRDRIHAVHALDVDLSGEYMRPLIEHDHPSEAVPKRRIMEQYPARRRIAIGDSYSDFEMAAAADVVFARDRLLKELKGSSRVLAFEDFFDVRAALQRRR
jgi:2-hydroxy-3-keto-5-methylthiopentenyl-1-phosphate phosphatase